MTSGRRRAGFPGHAVCYMAAFLLTSPAWSEVELIRRWDFQKAGVSSDLTKPGTASDPLAEGGKALRLVWHEKIPNAHIINQKHLNLAGRGTAKVSVRGTNLRRIDDNLRLRMHLTNEKSGKSFPSDMIVSGARINDRGYREIPIEYQVAAEPDLYTLNIYGAWPKYAEDSKAVIWIEKVIIETHNNRTPYISRLWKDKTNYRPRGPVRAKVFVVNPMKTEFSGRVTVEERYGLDLRRKVLSQKLSCQPGETVELDVSWNAGAAKAGHTFIATLLDSVGRQLDLDEGDYGVETDARSLHFGVKDMENSQYKSRGLLYVYPTSHTESRNIIAGMREERIGRYEFFSWAYCDLASFLPPGDPYLGNSGAWWLSVREYKDQIKLMNDAGIHTVSYILGHAVGNAGYQLLHKHPDWFVYDKRGEIGSYDMSTQNHLQRRREFGFKQHKHRSMLATFDATHPKARRWIADQIITLGKEMGFRGARWDVWFMWTSPDYYRIDGTRQVADHKVADKTTAESIRAIKSMVNRKLPDFTWGYNFASPEENKEKPLTLAEMCRGRGWLLDELSIVYWQKTSPFHTWDVYSKRMVEWGDHIRQLDGIYNPWPFHRGHDPRTKSADWLYLSCFHLLAGGRHYTGGFYKNKSALAGDMSLMAFRYSNLFSGWDLRLQPQDQDRISVEAPDTVWWRGYVFTNKSLTGRSQDIVHLVNSPLVMEAEAKPVSRVRPPTGAIQVRCRGRDGRMPRKAWLVCSESLTPSVEPKVQALPLTLKTEGGQVAVTVPSLLYFKSVVFEY